MVFCSLMVAYKAPQCIRQTLIMQGQAIRMAESQPSAPCCGGVVLTCKMHSKTADLLHYNIRYSN